MTGVRESAPRPFAPAGELRTGLGASGRPTIAETGTTGNGDFCQPTGAGAHARGVRHPATAYRDPTGQIWRYSGKRARVLAMLATGRGVTQWDCLPWHTRLGGTIHVLRCDGLAIETEREGEYRHARYWLRTPGAIVGKPGA